MTKQSLTVEFDVDTLRQLTALGNPAEVIAQLVHSTVQAVCVPAGVGREHTDRSLRSERETSDAALATNRRIVEQAADAVVQLARERADAVVQAARDVADDGRVPHSSAAEARSRRARADERLATERSTADAQLEHERGLRPPAERIASERRITDEDLTDERAQLDALIIEQRDANQHLVGVTMRARDLATEAGKAKALAEDSRQELLAVAEFREMFIGIVGHDLRTPLGAIVMAAGFLLQRGHLDQQDTQTVGRIIRSSQRMTHMITQLLDLTCARLGDGLPIDPAPTDLGELCQHVVAEFEAGIELDIEGDMRGVWDAARLAQALSNLAGNAVAYAEPGTSVVIRARAEKDAVMLEVINRGAPIPASLLPFVFEPFRRGEQRRQSPAGSLGLGLYIADQIVMSHRGTLRALCADGTTTFVIRLPRWVPPAA
jgi:signal transduction histidine kinase